MFGCRKEQLQERKARLTNRSCRNAVTGPAILVSDLTTSPYPQQHHHIRLRSLPSSVNTVTMSGVSQLRKCHGSEPPADSAICSSRTPSTSKPPLPRPHDRTLLTTDRSAIIRSNITLLGTVFVSAFGMQLYVATPACEAA